MFLATVFARKVATDRPHFQRGRWIFVACATLLIVAECGFTATPTRGATAGDDFSDLSGHATEQPAIARIVAQGIMGPASPGKFDPDGVVTRGEFALSMQRMFALRPPVNPPAYPDVPPGTPTYLAAAAAGAYLGAQIMCGGCVLSNNFFPDQAVSNGDVTITLVNLLVLRKSIALETPDRAASVLTSVPETDDFSPLAKRFFATAITNGFLALRADNTIDLGLEPTRAELAVELDNIQQKFDLPKVNTPP
jgi:hypothetical protein